MKPWSLSTMARQDGKLAVVTGANSGIGYYTALELGRAGAKVIAACRSETKGKAAVAAMQRAAPNGDFNFEALDLADLQSVREFAGRLQGATPALDILINNAGILGLPKRQTTKDGFEAQIGTNFLGHFALTGLVLPQLIAAKAPRVVQLASIAHRQGRINLADFQAEKTYNPMVVYQQTKLAMLMFALELQRRSDANDWHLVSVAAHPGVARTEIINNGMGPNSPVALAIKIFGPIFTHSAAAGALPSLLAATAPDIEPGGYYGPVNLMEFKGPPGIAKISAHALDKQVAVALWERAVALTGIDFKTAP